DLAATLAPEHLRQRRGVRGQSGHQAGAQRSRGLRDTGAPGVQAAVTSMGGGFHSAGESAAGAFSGDLFARRHCDAGHAAGGRPGRARGETASAPAKAAGPAPGWEGFLWSP
ncbi:unnamed protein product, partial [Effrenium voratum]